MIYQLAFLLVRYLSFQFFKLFLQLMIVFFIYLIIIKIISQSIQKALKF